jgi:hypothetical protein
MVVVMGGMALGVAASAAEHGGTTQKHGGATQEHGGATQEHGGQSMQQEPSAEQIRGEITAYVQEQERETEAFRVDDEVTGTTRTLTLTRVHDRVGKTGDFYYACADLTDTASGELLDLDFDVEQEADGELDVVNVRIHKVAGQARYTYDDDSNRVPVTN